MNILIIYNIETSLFRKRSFRFESSKSMSINLKKK